LSLRGIKAVSLFDGVSCGRLALDRAGIAVMSYEAFEIDKYAMAVSRHNYPCIQQRGDVLDADFAQFQGYDIVMGGSPCTFWSIAKTNREADKGGMGWKLFMRFAEAVRVIQPRFFLYENVASMPASIKAYISEELGCEPIPINSALVSAQSRKRLYWTNISGISQPEDKGILLMDILEAGMAARQKSCCIDACYYKGGSRMRLDNQSGKRQMVFEPAAFTGEQQAMPPPMHEGRAAPAIKRGKAPHLCADDADGALRTHGDENGCFKRLEARGDCKLDTATIATAGYAVCAPIRVGSYGTGGQGNRIYSVHGKTVSIMANGGGRGGIAGLYKIDLPDGDYIVRKLTPVEAERCQTMPDNYTALGIDASGKAVRISNTQRYKCAGNGWTVDVIAHILGFADFEPCQGVS